MQKYRKTDKETYNCPKHLQSTATQAYNVLRPRRQLSVQKPNYNETLPLGRAAVTELYKVYAGDAYSRPRPNQVQRRGNRILKISRADTQFGRWSALGVSPEKSECLS
jgi:hypothetical protein